MRRLGILWVVMLTIGILIVGMAGGATPQARAQADDCRTTPPAPTPGETSPPITFPRTVDGYTFTVGKAGDGFDVHADGGSQATSISIMTSSLPSGLTCDAPTWDGVLRSAGINRHEGGDVRALR